VAFARVRSHRQGLAPNGACPNNRFLDSPCGGQSLPSLKGSRGLTEN